MRKEEHILCLTCGKLHAYSQIPPYSLSKPCVETRSNLGIPDNLFEALSLIARLKITEFNYFISQTNLIV